MYIDISQVFVFFICLIFYFVTVLIRLILLGGGRNLTRIINQNKWLCPLRFKLRRGEQTIKVKCKGGKHKAIQDFFKQSQQSLHAQEKGSMSQEMYHGKGWDLLGCRRDCCTAASAAAMAIPASSRWAWVTLLLLWLLEGPWERSWPSEEDLELPGLLCDFSKGNICMSGGRWYKRVKVEQETWDVNWNNSHSIQQY